MSFKRFLLFALFVLCCCAPGAGAAAENASGKLWDRAMPVMQEGVDHLAEGGGKDNRTVTEFFLRQEPKFKRIVKKCFVILCGSENNYLEQLAALEEDAAALRKKIVQYRQKRISAPQHSKNPFADTQESLGKDIEKATRTLTAMEQQANGVKEALLGDIQRRGAGLTREQLDGLLAGVDGDDIMAIMNTAHNIKLIQANIEKVLQSDEGSAELAQMYTGIYMMLNETYAFAHEQAIGKITERYLPRLDQLYGEAKALRSEAKAMSVSADASQRNVLRANMTANERTMRVAEQYKDYLRGQLAHLETSKKIVDKNVRVATNTYRTVRTANTLLGLMRSATAEFDSIFAFRLPELSLLYDAELRREFDGITKKLRED